MGAQECADCEVKIFTGASVTAEDPYQAGASLPKDMYSSVCVDCYEKLQSEREEEESLREAEEAEFACW